jgi:hypothetical protein
LVTVIVTVPLFGGVNVTIIVVAPWLGSTVAWIAVLAVSVTATVAPAWKFVPTRFTLFSFAALAVVGTVEVIFGAGGIDAGVVIDVEVDPAGATTFDWTASISPLNHRSENPNTGNS